MKIYVPGPSYVYAGVGASGAYLQLGYTERTVRIANAPKHRGVQVDLAGDMDFDVQFMGEEIYVSIRLARYTESVLQYCKQRLNATMAPFPGTVNAGGIGSLLVAENNTFSLVVVSAYYTKTIFSGDMVPGFHLPQAYLADGDDRELGMDAKVEQVTFRTIPRFGVDGSYVLYTQSDIPGLSLPTPV